MTDRELEGIELKPCPFCGGRVDIYREGGTSIYSIRCSNCWLKIQDGFAPTRMRAEALAGFYNRRAGDSSP